MGAGPFACAAEFEALVPVGRRLKILAVVPLAAQTVIGCAFLRILEDLIGLAQFLETVLPIGLLADVRMIFARELAIRAPDLVLRRGAWQSENLVVVPVFHSSVRLIPGRAAIAYCVGLLPVPVVLPSDHRTRMSPVCRGDRPLELDLRAQTFKIAVNDSHGQLPATAT